MSDTTDTTEARAVPVRVHATLDGWPIDLDLTIAPARLPVALAKLAALGFTPAAPAAAPAAQVAQGRPAGSSSPPTCPVHGTAKIREGKRGGYYCAARLADDSYCKERPI